MELRQAMAADAPAIRELTREAYAKWVPVIGREPKPMTADYAAAVRKHRFDLLHVEGKLAALIETIAEGDHLLIENVAVSPSFQGRGLGRKLMAHADQIAMSLGFGEIRLYTNKLFAENVQLYSRLGYRVDREEELSDGIAVHMSKPVTDLQRTGERTLAGKCYCGAVHYAVADAFAYALNCHCSNCRRTTGSAFKPFAGIARDRLRITKGKDNILIFGNENAGNMHCKACGSLLYSVVRDGAFVHVAMGTLVDAPAIRPTAHIFVGSKAPWFTITDDLPQYQEHVEAARPAD
jgi:ribosomal protein S18 acetylase RimI-like enzyme